MGGVSSSETRHRHREGCRDAARLDFFGFRVAPNEVPELRSYRVVTAVMNWQQKRGLALWMFCRVETEPGTMLQ